MLTSPPNTGEPPEKPRGSFAKNRVLVIDDDPSIDVHISARRKKPGDDLKPPHFIKTIRAVGYMMINPHEE